MALRKLIPAFTPMKLLLLLLLVVSTCLADDAKPLFIAAGKLIAQPDLKSPLGPEWWVAKGTWQAKDGVLTGTIIAEENHAAVLQLATKAPEVVWECEFRLRDAKVFYVGFDGADHHVGRVIVTPAKAKLCEDSTEVKGVSPVHTLTETAVELKPDDWQHLRVEQTGEKLAARLNDVELQAEHPYLSTPKTRWWFAVGGGTAEMRNVRVSEGKR